MAIAIYTAGVLNSIILPSGASIPADPTNADYQAFLASGVVPTPLYLNAVQASAAQVPATATDITNAINALLLKSASQHASTDFATSAQGTEADNAVQLATLTSTLTNYLTKASEASDISTVNSAISTEASNRISGDNTEAAARAGADTTLTTNLNAEASARLAGDSKEASDIVTEAALRAAKPDVYFGSTKQTAPKYYANSVAIATVGIAIFYLTVDGTAGGAPLMTNPNLASLNIWVNDATSSYQTSAVLSNSNKTLTVTCNKLTTANLLTGVLGQAPAPINTIVSVQIYGQ